MASEKNLINIAITEIMYNPEKGRGDWVEAYVLADTDCNLKASNRQIIDFHLCTKINSDGSCSQSWPVYSTDDGCHFKKGDYLILTSQTDDFSNSTDFAILKLSSSFNLLSNEDAFIAYSDDNKITWQESIRYDDFFDKRQKGYSLEKIDFEKDNTRNNWQESYVLGGTPGHENSKEPTEDDETDKRVLPEIEINEIYPYPDTGTGEKEFVEFRNISAEKISVSKCRIEDNLHHKSSSFPIDLDPGGIDYAEGSFNLNNDEDTAYIYCDNFEDPIDSVAYKGAKDSFSYSLNGTDKLWRWTSQKTPGEINKFDQKTIISFSIKKDDDIYKNIYADFKADVKTKGDFKFTWNFGDGHRSYLQKTRHKFIKTGIYDASLKVYNKKESAIQNFEIEVTYIDKPKVKITGLNPNPKGADTENEWLMIKNQSKNKVNLKGWSIATGWKKLYNHPIRDDFVLKKGQSKKLAKKICAYTLNNTQTKIELRYPDGSVAQKIKYDRKKNKIKDDETFELNGKSWDWNAPLLPEGEDGSAVVGPDERETANPEENNIAPEDIILVPDSEIQANLGKSTPNTAWESRKYGRIQLISYGTNINTPQDIFANQGRVLGASIERKTAQEKHWAAYLMDKFWKRFNLSINQLILNL